MPGPYNATLFGTGTLAYSATTYAGTVINDCWMDTPASAMLVPRTN